MLFNDRTQQVLLALVGSYIKDALPIGSRTLTKNFEFGLSPATIRNIMADLEEEGYLLQPHTSAGRIPTEKGYRYYVDSLVVGNLTEWEVQVQEEELAAKREDAKELLQEASQILSFLSHYAGIVVAPDVSHTLLKQLEFIKLRRGHFLVILITEDGFIQNRIIEMDLDLEQRDLNRIAGILNEEFSGLDLQEVRRRILREMEEQKAHYDQMLQKVLVLGQRALRTEPESEVYFGGTSNILDLPEFSDLDKMRTIMKAFEEKAAIIKLLNQCMDSGIDGNRVQVFIGSENRNQSMGDCSLVVANYRQGDRTIGSLGVLGPTRMEYERVIPIVDNVAKALTRVLSEQ